MIIYVWDQERRELRYKLHECLYRVLQMWHVSFHWNSFIGEEMLALAERMSQNCNSHLLRTE